MLQECGVADPVVGLHCLADPDRGTDGLGVLGIRDANLGRSAVLGRVADAEALERPEGLVRELVVGAGQAWGAGCIFQAAHDGVVLIRDVARLTLVHRSRVGRDAKEAGLRAAGDA
jgi:hypothetical protein